jgi:sec-independent protein translocase protein TatA
MGSMSIAHWLIVLAVVILVFGSGKIKSLGKDLGGAFSGFKEAVREAKGADEEVRKVQQEIKR